MIWVKQSTAVTKKLGPFLDEDDGKTTEEGLTIAQADIRLSKNGGNFAQTNNAAGASHDEKGFYGVPLNTTDTDTLGSLQVNIHEGGALPVFIEYLVVTANAYDSMVLGTDNLDVVALSLGTQAKTDVNAELINVIFTDTLAEAAAVPAKDASFGDKVNFMFSFSRNGGTHNRDTGALTVRNDAGAIIGTCAVADTGGPTGTLTRGKMA